MRFPEGYAEPWHSHTSTYHSVLIKGTFKTRSKENPEPAESFGPGAYLMQPGEAAHAEMNGVEGEMVALVYFEGPIDVVLES